MSSKSAWKKIVDDYQRRKPARGTRAAYEEMASTWNEMCGESRRRTATRALAADAASRTI